MAFRRNVLAATVLAFFLVCAFSSVASAAVGALVDTVAKWDHRIEVWNRYYYLSLCLVVAVAALGAISGMLQKSSASAWKTAAMLCAYGVTIITVIVNAASVMDYREIKKAIDNADRKVTQLNMLIEKARLKESDIAYQMAIIEQAQGLIGELHDIQTRVNIGSAMGYEFIKTAHAAPPGWVSGPSQSTQAKDVMQFVGIGQDRDLGRARDKAGTNFLEQIEDYIKKNIDAVVKRSTITAA
jgi:ABC-type transport system involved in multi-copper enzyme maturation permease subunit